MLRHSVCYMLAVLLLLTLCGAAIAQNSSDAPPPPADPAGGRGSAGQQGGGMGPPGMEFPADVVIADAPQPNAMEKAGSKLWIVAVIVAVIAIGAWVMSRKKKQG